MKNKLQFVNQVCLSLGSRKVQIKETKTYDLVETILKLIKDNDALDTLLDEQNFNFNLSNKVIDSETESDEKSFDSPEKTDN